MSRWQAPALLAGLLTAVLLAVGVGVALQPTSWERSIAACDAAFAAVVMPESTGLSVTSCETGGFFSYEPLGSGVAAPVDETPAGPRVKGVVRFFDDEQGWGVVDSPQTPGGAFVIFSSIDAEGYRQLDAGQHVTFVAQPPGQEGYDYYAEAVRVPRP